MTAGVNVVERLLVETGRASHSTCDSACTDLTPTDLTHGLGEGGQFVVFGDRRRESPLTAQHLPPARHRDAARVLVTQIP